MAETNKYGRLKILYLYKILFEQTDESHSLTMPQIIEKLSEYGFHAARKALYEDIEALRAFGVDIVSTHGNKSSYSIVSRDFEIPELMLLADAVICSPFFTDKKAKVLLKKLERLCSIHEAKQYGEKVFFTGDARFENEKIYMNIDMIQRAVMQKKQISFRYFDYNIKRQKVYRSGLRTCSPYAFAWDNEKYYLIAHYEKYGGISHFRVDKMDSVKILDIPAYCMPKNFKLSEYLKSTFSMFSGETEQVEVMFRNQFVNAVFDRFGKNVKMERCGDEHFIAQIKVRIEHPEAFFSWLFRFGTGAQIVKPIEIKERYKQMLQDVHNCQ